MGLLAGPYYAAALLAGVAGIVKLARPGAAITALRAAGLPARSPLVRALGIVELAIAALAVTAGPAGAAGLAAAYLGFALYARHAAGRAASCGCFGAADAPLGGLHVTVNLALAAVAAAVAIAPLPGPGRVLDAQPATALPFVLLVGATAYLLYLTMTRFAELQVLARR